MPKHTDKEKAKNLAREKAEQARKVKRNKRVKKRK